MPGTAGPPVHHTHASRHARHVAPRFTTNHERQCPISLLSFVYLAFLQAFTTGVPMDEDILSDVVPSNIVSRQASEEKNSSIKSLKN